MTATGTSVSGDIDARQRARIVFLITVPQERTSAFLEAYEHIRYIVAAGVHGHICDQVCRSTAQPD